MKRYFRFNTTLVVEADEEAAATDKAEEFFEAVKGAVDGVEFNIPDEEPVECNKLGDPL